MNASILPPFPQVRRFAALLAILGLSACAQHIPTFAPGSDAGVIADTAPKPPPRGLPGGCEPCLPRSGSGDTPGPN